MSPGEMLRSYRERLGLTVRDVETASSKLAHKYSNVEFTVSISRLSDIETKGVVPSIFKLYSLASIYRHTPSDLHKLYGVNFENATADSEAAATTRTHLVSTAKGLESIDVPTKLDPGFDTKTTFNVGRMIQRWGVVPLSYLSRFASREFSYGFIGTSDFMMYPVLQPGSFVQIDEKFNKVSVGSWRTELERPIYFVETRDEYFCCWCEENDSLLTLRPHPLSPNKTRVLKLGSEAEVLGQVVGVAMKLRINVDAEKGD